jgi:hypothetical protein
VKESSNSSLVKKTNVFYDTDIHCFRNRREISCFLFSKETVFGVTKDGRLAIISFLTSSHDLASRLAATVLAGA